MQPILYLVVPCYNEEEVLPETVHRLTDKLDSMTQGGIISGDSRMIFVDDGSKDKTWQLIEAFHKENPYVCGLKLSRNRGHQNALLAGLMHAKEPADCVICRMTWTPSTVLSRNIPKAATSSTACGTSGKPTRFSNAQRPEVFTPS